MKGVERRPSTSFSIIKAGATYQRFCSVHCVGTRVDNFERVLCQMCCEVSVALILPHAAVGSFWGSNPIVPTQCTICDWILHQALLEANSQALRHILARCWPWDPGLQLRSCVATLACVQPCTIQGSMISTPYRDKSMNGDLKYISICSLYNCQCPFVLNDLWEFCYCQILLHRMYAQTCETIRLCLL